MQSFFTKKRNIAAFTICAVLLAALIAGVVLSVVLYRNGSIPAENFSRRMMFAGLCFLICAAIYLAEFLLRFRFPLFLEISLTVFAFACLAGGTVFDLYNIMPVWDKILHTLSGVLFSAAGLCFALPLLGKQITGARKIAVCVIVAALFSLAVGYLWEVYEFTVDSIDPSSNCQRWENGLIEALPDGTYLVDDRRGSAILDTMGDMIVNLIGTVVFLVPALFVFLKKPAALEQFALERIPRRKETADKNAASDCAASAVSDGKESSARENSSARSSRSESSDSSES